MSIIAKIGGHELTLFVVDAFSSQPFKGNSAAVCLLPFHETIPKDIKQKIAAEMKLSETAFITTKSGGDTFATGSSFGLEWFTPTCEVNLCGHATLASAAVLFLIFDNNSDEIMFETISGTLIAKRLGRDQIQINLPAYKFSSAKEKYDKLIKVTVGLLPVEDVVLSESKKLLIRLSDKISRQEFESFRTNDDEMLAASSEVMGVIVTLKAVDKKDCKDEEGKQYDFVSRYFGPWMGVSEDPVTGSAHSVLAPYWAEILKKKTFHARQCSARGGDLDVELTEDRVILNGHAVVVIQGKIIF